MLRFYPGSKELTESHGRAAFVVGAPDLKKNIADLSQMIPKRNPYLHFGKFPPH